MGKKMNGMQVSPLGSLSLEEKIAQLLSPEYGSSSDSEEKLERSEREERIYPSGTSKSS